MDKWDCEGCKHEDKKGTQVPCCDCGRRMEDWYEPISAENDFLLAKNGDKEALERLQTQDIIFEIPKEKKEAKD